MQINKLVLPAFDNNTRAFLWESGSIFDLNTLIPAGSALHLQWARGINDRGEIGDSGLDSDSNVRAFLLIPCDENHPGVQGCDYSMVEEPARSLAPRKISGETQRPPQSQPTHRFHIPGLQSLSR